MEIDLAFADTESRVARKDFAEGRFPLAVRPHDCMYFAGADGQVYAFKYFFAVNRGV